MPGNSFGHLFRLTTWGESHGKAIGGVIDGCPAGIPLSEKDIQPDLDRRRPGQSNVTTARDEADQVEILSGVFEGKTTGTPISLIIFNKDQRSQDYDKIKDTFRKGHADETYQLKYGHRDYRGGGRASARETAMRVAGAAIAKKVIAQNSTTKIVAYTKQIGDLTYDKPNLDVIEQNSVRAADLDIAGKMKTAILAAKEAGDSLGATIEAQIIDCPIGLGEPVFDKFKADLAKAMLSINAVMGFEYGPGFDVVNLKGSENNEIEIGIYGGITNGKPITLRIALKPTASIKIEGRHDPCLAPRAVPVIEAMIWLTIADHYLRNLCT
ncbi:chorismate synthase [Candidatus Peregrinibacteria bacterium]|nr:chorismate synthase [Candidatus Peregrinibacteria bacterium]